MVGSPPHTRGTLKEHEAEQRRTGITPAYAGNTNIRDHRHSDHKDHPRIRGEHVVVIDMKVKM